MGPPTPDAFSEQRPAQLQLPPDAIDFLRAVSQRQVVSRAQSGLLAQDRLYPVVFEVLKSAAPAPAVATAPSYSGALDYYASARSASARRSLSNKTSAPDLSQRAHTAAVAGGHRRSLTGGLMFDSDSELLSDPFGDDIGAEGPLDGGMQFLFEPAAAGGPVLFLFTPEVDKIYTLPQASTSWTSLASARSRTSVRSHRLSSFLRNNNQRSGAFRSGTSTPPLSRQPSLAVAPSSGYASASASVPASPGYATSVVSLASIAPGSSVVPAAPSLATLAPALTRSHRTAQRLQPTWDAAIADRVAADVRDCLADGAIAPDDVGEVTAVASRSLARVAACALTAPAPLRPNASSGSLIRPPSWAGSSDTALREQVAHAVTDAPAAYLRAALDAVRARRVALQSAEHALAQRLVFRYAPGAASIVGGGAQEPFSTVSQSSRSSVRLQSSGASVAPHSVGDASEAQPRSIGSTNALGLRAPVLPSIDMPPFNNSALLGTLSVDPTARASDEASSASANEPGVSPASGVSINLPPTPANNRSLSSPSSALSLEGSSLSLSGSATIPGAFPESSSSGQLSHASGTLASPGNNPVSPLASSHSPGAETSSSHLLSLPTGSSGTRSRPSPRPLSEHVNVSEPFGAEDFATEVANRSLDRSVETNASGIDTNVASYATLSTSVTIASTATTLSARSSVKTNATSVSTDITQLKTSDDEAFQYSTPMGQPSTPSEGADCDTTQSTITHSTITQSNTTQSTPTPTTFKVSPQKQTTPVPQQRKKKIGLARFFIWIAALRSSKKSAATSSTSAPAANSNATAVPSARDPVASANSTIRERAPEPKGTEHTSTESRGRAKGKEVERPFSQSLGPAVNVQDASASGLGSKHSSAASGINLAPSFMSDTARTHLSTSPENLFSDDDPALAEVIEAYPPNTVPALVRKHVLAYYVKASREAQGASQSQQALNGARAMLLSGPATSTSTAAAGDLHVLTPDETRLVFEQAISLFQCVLLNSCAAHNARVHAARGDGSRRRLSSASVIAEEPQFLQLPDSIWKVDVSRLATVFVVDDGASYCLPEMIDQVKKRKIKEARFYASRARPQKNRRNHALLGPAASRSSRSVRPLARIPSERLANGPSHHTQPPQEQEAS